MKKEIKKEVTVLVEKVKTPKKVEKTVTPKKRKSVLIQPTLTVSIIELMPQFFEDNLFYRTNSNGTYRYEK